MRQIPLPTKKPIFAWVAAQTCHEPLQATEYYLKKCSHIQNGPRRTFCGMANALDDMTLNISQAFQDAGIWEDTLLIFTADNGGLPSGAGNNFPLRAGKTTLWEGGLRAVGFVRGAGIPEKVKNTTSNVLMHATDWFPTLIRGVVGGTTEDSLPLDGINQWPALTQGVPTERVEILHNLDQMNKFSALRSGKWKIVVGRQEFADWYPLPPAKPIPAPYTNVVGLFDISTDPNEENDVALQYPDIVQTLLARLDYYRSVAEKPWYPDADPLSDPKYFNGTWSPWRVLGI